MKFSVLQRRLHRWGAIAVAAPLVLIISTGILLQLKKQSDWIQPPAQTGTPGRLEISFEEILAAAESADAGITSWGDVDRLDVRPHRGIAKVRGTNRWEVQVDTATGEVLQVAYRRSDLIESLHDGSWFHDSVKLWVFLPCAAVFLGLWITGLYLFILPHWVRRRRRRNS